MEQVARRLVEKQPRRVDVLAVRATLEVLDHPHDRIRRARTDRALVLDRRAVRTQVDLCRHGEVLRLGDPDRLELRQDVHVLDGVVPEIGQVAQPAHPDRLAISDDHRRPLLHDRQYVLDHRLADSQADALGLVRLDCCH
jgi:hypothetical protein